MSLGCCLSSRIMLKLPSITASRKIQRKSRSRTMAMYAQSSLIWRKSEKRRIREGSQWKILFFFTKKPEDKELIKLLKFNPICFLIFAFFELVCLGLLILIF